jgi:excinuclease ABC subunit B
VLADLETRMREAAADLNFEEAARLRDEVKRLRATELAVVDDPTAKQRVVQGKAGAYAGTKKYGESANLPRGSSKRGGNNTPRAGASSRGAASSPSPLAGSEASEARSRGRGGGSTSRDASKVHKPHLDEMHGPESLPYRPDRTRPRKPSLDDAGSGSKIFQPTDSRQSGPEFGPTPRSSGGAPGHRGGWKKR